MRCSRRVATTLRRVRLTNLLPLRGDACDHRLPVDLWRGVHRLRARSELERRHGLVVVVRTRCDQSENDLQSAAHSFVCSNMDSNMDSFR
jgi:hypothetical protein